MTIQEIVDSIPERRYCMIWNYDFYNFSTFCEENRINVTFYRDGMIKFENGIKSYETTKDEIDSMTCNEFIKVLKDKLDLDWVSYIYYDLEEDGISGREESDERVDNGGGSR